MKMKKISLIVFLLVLIAGFSFAQEPQVYIAGYDGNDAVYWHNDGVKTTRYVLPKESETAQANAIAVSDSDIYIVGTDGNDAVYWLNGNRIVLPTIGNRAEANDIAISGSNVYIVGTDGGDAVCWHNGNCIVLPKTSEWGASADSISISGSNIYITGNEGSIPVYWLNFSRKIILPDFYNMPLESSAIIVIGSNVHRIGSAWGMEHPTVALYWYNGQITILPIDGYYDSFARGIAVDGSNVYISGSVRQYISHERHAVYWHNENIVFLEKNNPYWEKIYSKSNAITVLNSNIYIAGSILEDWDHRYRAVYWYNGERVRLPVSARTVSDALAITVVP